MIGRKIATQSVVYAIAPDASRYFFVTGQSCVLLIETESKREIKRVTDYSFDGGEETRKENRDENRERVHRKSSEGEERRRECQ